MEEDAYGLLAFGQVVGRLFEKLIRLWSIILKNMRLLINNYSAKWMWKVVDIYRRKWNAVLIDIY